ncbi:aldo/keto reductase [Streptomyces sp. NPDC057062]|uniref:aldo/keto reductase n=1 Tax=unclassified Streptomyces TaxID=2593676 RepID=UPI0027E11C6C|nr:aldo/keto reductase [Streptomyces sp. MBT84]
MKSSASTRSITPSKPTSPDDGNDGVRGHSGHGLPAGRFASFDELPEKDQRRRLPRFQQDNLQANLDTANEVRAAADRIGATPAQAALAWLMAQGLHVVPVPGTKTPKYLTDNAGAADVRLSPADLAELDAVPAPVGGRY